MPTNEFEKNPIHNVKFVPIEELAQYGFSDKSIQMIQDGFPNAGNYMGDKTNTGLGV